MTDKGSNTVMDGVRSAIEAGAAFDKSYVMMNALAAIIACYGLLSDNASGVIGAMLVAMLLGPIMGVGLALVDGDNRLLRRAAVSEIGGVLLVLGIAVMIGWFHRDVTPGQELLSRTDVNLPALMIALAGGAAGAYATISPNLSAAVVGVAIATALVPPLTTCGIFLARGDMDLALGGFMLAFANMVAIQVAASVVLWFAGYHRVLRRDGATNMHVLLRQGVSLFILGTLFATLAVQTHQAVRSQMWQAGIRTKLEEVLRAFPGVHLASLRTTQNLGAPVVHATVQSPRPFTAQEVVSVTRQLALPAGAPPVKLQVHPTYTEIISTPGAEPGKPTPDTPAKARQDP
jgi:uncharacterized hydrophobic protein (TIGR00271 family)